MIPYGKRRNGGAGARGGEQAFLRPLPPVFRIVIPGEYILKEGEDIVANVGRRTLQLVVTNTGDRPIQVGSHYHFFEVNRFLQFEREKAYGMRLNIPAGTAVRFEPGDQKRVELVEIGGTRTVYGLNGLVGGNLEEKKGVAIKKGESYAENTQKNLR